jgi:hypothetical protein
MASGEQVLIGAVLDPASPPRAVSARLLDEMQGHRLAPLAWDTIATSGNADAWPESIQLTLRRASAAQALASDLLDAELRRVIAAAGDAGVHTVLIKGAALAYTHYRRPHLRPRSDSDIVIREGDRDAMARVLVSLGYTRSDAVDGSLITQQFQWTFRLTAGLVHAVDVHWRVFNPHLFGDVLSTGELLDRAVPVRALGPHARSPSTVDALVLACVHRVAHHAGEEDAIWDFDIHLLISSLHHDDAAAFIRKVVDADVRAVCAAGISSAKSRFGTRLPAELESLVEHAADTREQTAVFLEPGRRQVDVLASDLGALGSWRARAALVRQHLFPPPHYMLKKYRRSNRAWLPLLYTRRILTGVPRWLKSQRS